MLTQSLRQVARRFSSPGISSFASIERMPDRQDKMRLTFEGLEARQMLTVANPVGDQFLVNEAFSLESSPPAITVLNASGDFVAAWQSYEEGADYLGHGVYVQRFLSNGTPLDMTKILVNSASIEGDQIAPALASDGNGNYLVTWQSFSAASGSFDVYARWYNATTNSLGNAFLVNSTTDGDQSHASAAMDGAGNAVIAWQSDLQDGDGFGIFAKKYSFEETGVLDEIAVNTLTIGDQLAPDVAMTSAGQFVIGWQGIGTVEAESSFEIFARRYSADGMPLDMEEILVNTTTIRDQVTPGVAVDDNANFVVAWVGEGIPGSGSDVFGRRFGNDGTAAGAEFRVNSTIIASQVAPDVGMNGTGEFLVTWQSVHQDGYSWGIYAHEYDAAGNTVVGKDEFQVNQWVMGPQTGAVYAVNPGGKGVFAWLGNDPDHRPAVHGKNYSLPGSSVPATVTDMILANFVALEDTPPAAFMDAAGNSVVVWQSYGEDGDGLGIYAKRIGFDGETITEAFLVNSTMTIGNQSRPAIGGNASGRYVIVWQADDSTSPGHDVWAQRYDENDLPVGNAFMVNTTTDGDQSNPVVAMAEDGSFVVVWQSPDEDLMGDPAGYGIFARRFDADGMPVDSGFQVNSERLRDQVAPSVAMNGAGQFVVGWVSDHPAVDDPDDPEKSVFVQWFGADGSFNGPEVIAHEYVKDAQEHPDVGIDAEGNFVVTWQSINQEGMMGNSWGVYVRQFDAGKNPLTPQEIHVNQLTAGPQRYSTVGMDADGNFAVAWQSNSHLQDGSSWEIYLRQFDAEGNPLRDEEVVNTWSSGPQINPIVARSVTGNFGVFFSGQGDTRIEGVHGRLYDVNLPDTNSLPTRIPIGDQFLVAETFALEGSAPDIATDASGDFVVTWESFEEDGSGWGVYAQQFTAAGIPKHDAFPVNEQVLGDQHAPAVAVTADGHFLIVWQGNSQDPGGEGYDIFGAWFDPNGDRIGSEFRINDEVVADQVKPDVALGIGTDGVFAVVTWQGQDSSGTGIHAKWLSGAGDEAGSAEFVVNNDEVGDQLNPAIAMAADAHQFVIVWQGPDNRVDPSEASVEVFGRRYVYSTDIFESAGNEFVVNEVLERDQVDATVAMNASGAFVVAFVDEGQQASGSDVYVRRFDAAASALGGDMLVNQETARPQRAPAVGMDDSGRFLVAWQSSHQEPDPFSWGVFGREYDTVGMPVQDEFLVNTLTSGPQTGSVVSMNGSGQAVVGWLGLDAAHQPSVHGKRYQLPDVADSAELVLAHYLAPEEAPPAAGMDAAGNSLVVWQSYLEDGSGLGIFAQKLDHEGNPMGDRLQINSTTAGNQSLPSVATNANGFSVVVWQSEDQDGEGYGIFGRRVGSDGTLIGDEFLVNAFVMGDQLAPDVAIAADGTFVVVWQAPDGDGFGIFARRFNPDGTPIDVTEFQVNQFVDLEQSGPSVAINAAHQFVVVWVSDHMSLSDPVDNEKSVFAQVFDASLATTGPEVLVHRFVKDAQEHPDVGVDAFGNFVVVWQSINQDGNTWGVFARQFLADKTPLQVREFAVNTTRKGPQRYASVAVAEDGRFVVTWQSSSDLQVGSSWDLFAQQYAANGTREGGEVAVNTFTEGPQIHPVIAQAPDGEFGVYWVGRGTDKSEGVHGRIFRFPDYGDAPDTYGTSLNSHVDGGARHAWTGPWLGWERDREVDGFPSGSAMGDDLNALDDEDGVGFSTPLVPGMESVVYVNGSGGGLLSAWVDFDENGLFDSGEQIFVNVNLVPGWNRLTFQVPVTAIAGSVTYARFRYSTVADLGATGTAPDGEVEDYAVQICSTTVINTADDGFGSLRFALICANSMPGIQLISFAIPGVGPHTLSVLSALPEITDEVVIDGTTQPGFAGTPLIEIDGTLAGDSDGLVMKAPGTLQGLVVNRFTRSGIKVIGTSGVNILGNYVGTDALGTIALGNQAFGVNIRDSQNVLVRDNLLSGNAHSGLSIRGATAADNRVMGNHVGTDASGTAALANGLHGIVLTQGAHGNRIGGTSTGNGNLISGNQGMGVYVAGADTRYNRLRNNYIGVDETATIDLGNLQYGLFLDGSQANTVTGNVISGNEGFGVVIAGLTASENGLYANSIGTDASGAMNLGNGWHGVRVSDGAHNNRIGGGSPETANRIAFNVIDGVSLAGSNTIENAILGNSIYQNAGFGIDLGDNGFSPNDVGDPDVGTNMFQNYPELISISRLVSGDLQISYRVDSLPGFSNYPIRVEFFQADSSGQEGMVYLGFDLYRSADAAVGTKTFVFQPLVATGTGQRLVATATDGMGLLNTSEFSPDQFVV